MDKPDMSIINEIMAMQYEALQLNDDVWYRGTMGLFKARPDTSGLFEIGESHKLTPTLSHEMPIKKYLIIIDDNLESLKSYNSDLSLLCTKSRHYNITTIFTTQVFKWLPSTIR